MKTDLNKRGEGGALVKRYLKGTRINIAGQEPRVDNGTFEILNCLPQAGGDDYYVYGRVGSDGRLLNDANWFNRRGNFKSRLDAVATIVNQ